MRKRKKATCKSSRKKKDQADTMNIESSSESGSDSNSDNESKSGDAKLEDRPALHYHDQFGRRLAQVQGYELGRRRREYEGLFPLSDGSAKSYTNNDGFLWMINRWAPRKLSEVKKG